MMGDGDEREVVMGEDDEVLCWEESMADRMSLSVPLGRSMGLLDDLKKREEDDGLLSDDAPLMMDATIIKVSNEKVVIASVM